MFAEYTVETVTLIVNISTFSNGSFYQLHYIPGQRLCVDKRFQYWREVIEMHICHLWIGHKSGNILKQVKEEADGNIRRIYRLYSFTILKILRAK